MKKNWDTRIRGNKKAWIFFSFKQKKNNYILNGARFLQIISIVCLFVCTHVYLTNKLTWIKTKQQHGYYKFRFSLKNLNGMAKGYDIEEASRFFCEQKTTTTLLNLTDQNHVMFWTKKREKHSTIIMRSSRWKVVRGHYHWSCCLLSTDCSCSMTR